MVAKGYPYLVTVARKCDQTMIFTKFVGPQSRHPNNSEFEKICGDMLESKLMKNLPEKIITVDNMNMYIMYRVVTTYNVGGDGLVFFVFTPKSYNKSELRKLMKTLGEKFSAGLAEADIDDDNKLLDGAPNFLSTKSQIKNAIMEAVDSFGEGIAKTDLILAQLDKTKATMSKNIDEQMARNEKNEETLVMSEELVEQTSQFADKANKIKMAMMMKNLKMLICLMVLCGGLIGLLCWQLGLFD